MIICHRVLVALHENSFGKFSYKLNEFPEHGRQNQGTSGKDSKKSEFQGKYKV